MKILLVDHMALYRARVIDEWDRHSERCSAQALTFEGIRQAAAQFREPDFQDNCSIYIDGHRIPSKDATVGHVLETVK